MYCKGRTTVRPFFFLFTVIRQIFLFDQRPFSKGEIIKETFGNSKKSLDIWKGLKSVF